MQKEIYSNQQKDINRYIATISSHDQNNRAIHSCFEEKLNKAIHDTKQVDTDLSEACTKIQHSNFMSQTPDLTT
eukprot:14474211-Ditylum_brightwellii.AAC.1